MGLGRGEEGVFRKGERSGKGDERGVKRWKTPHGVVLPRENHVSGTLRT